MTDPPRREGVDQSALRRTLLVRWFRYKPLMKNIAISSLLLMFGEVAAQEIKNYMRLKGYSQPENGSMKKPECSDGTHSKKTENQFDLNLRMVGRQGLIGAFEGTYQHIYYTWLDRKLIGTSALVVAKKVALDEVAVGPMSLFVFLMFNGICNTGTISGGFEHVRDLFWLGFIADLSFWPLMQSINFAFVPSVYRVPYIALFTTVWNTYLCFINTRTHGTQQVKPQNVHSSDQKKRS